jgi:hypothetical protein
MDQKPIILYLRMEGMALDAILPPTTILYARLGMTL